MEKAKVFRTMFVAITLVLTFFAVSILTACGKEPENTYKITYVLNEGINSEENVATYNSKEDVVLHDPTRDGFSFVGWYTNESFEGEKITVISKDTENDITVYAKWSGPINYSITYILNGGTLITENPQSYNVYTTTFTLNSPTKQNLDFDGWYDNKDFTGNRILKIEKGTTGNITLFAKFVQIKLFEFNNNAVVGVTDKGKNEESLVIPSQYNGIEITEIAEEAFKECNTLKNIVLPSNLRKIGNNAFDSCQNLTEITIPASVRYIGERAFACNYALTSVTFEDGIEIQDLPRGVFFFCRSLKSIDIPETVTTIGYQAFTDCNQMGPTITIPKNVISIGGSAFWSCTSIENVVFEANSSLRKIGSDAFYWCKGLEDITIPKNVVDLGEGAFRSSGLQDIHFEEGSQLEVFKTETFASTQLDEIIIPENIKEICVDAFDVHNLFGLRVNSKYVYEDMLGLGTENAGGIMNVTSYIDVLKTIVDDEENVNEYITNTNIYLKTWGWEGYYRFLPVNNICSCHWIEDPNLYTNEALKDTWLKNMEYVGVSKELVENPNYTNNWLNNPENFTRIEYTWETYGKDYYLYSRNGMESVIIFDKAVFNMNNLQNTLLKNAKEILIAKDILDDDNNSNEYITNPANFTVMDDEVWGVGSHKNYIWASIFQPNAEQDRIYKRFVANDVLESQD